MMAGMRIPIACSLSATGAADRVEEWRSFLADHVEAATREPQVARLRLRPSDASLLTAVDLASRENECCPFLDFALEIEPDGRWLRIGAPPDAVSVLDDLLGLC